LFLLRFWGENRTLTRSGLLNQQSDKPGGERMMARLKAKSIPLFSAPLR